MNYSKAQLGRLRIAIAIFLIAALVGQLSIDSKVDTSFAASDTSLAIIYASFAADGSAGGVAYGDEDILAYDVNSGAWSLFFDGSDVGLGANDIDAFHKLDGAGGILISLSTAGSISGLGDVDDSDIILFTPTATGADTAGTFSYFFDGSDVGLITNSEDIDALTLLDDGRLLISTLGGNDVIGSGSRDEDIMLFTPTSLGANTSGSWSLYFDGSDIGLSDSGEEETWALWTNNHGGDIYLSTKGAFSAGSASGDGADIVLCENPALGSSSGCGALNIDWSGSAFGAAGATIDGMHLALDSGSSGPPTNTPTPTNTPLNTNTPTPTPANSSVSGGDQAMSYFSFASGGSAGSISFADEDIVAYDPAGGSWSLFFDGSDVGLGSSDINALHVLNGGSGILLSILSPATLPDVGAVDDSDIVLFTPTSLGDNTAGTFSYFFDGSDVGLTTNGEDVDSLTLLGDGRLLISTVGGFNVSGAGGADEDIILFEPAELGANTSGSWSLYFDGSDIGLDGDNEEEIWAIWSANTGSDIYLSTKGLFNASGAGGDGADILQCQNPTLGGSSACAAFGIYWDGSSFGAAGESINGMHLVFDSGGSNPPTNTPTPTPTNAPVNTPTPTSTPLNTPTPTNTPVNTPTQTPTPTNTPLPGGSGGRVTQNLVALYTFEDGSGSAVRDVSNAGAPLNLSISGNTSWISGGGLDVKGSTTIQSSGAASKVIQAAQSSNELTIEAWAKADNTNQSGPARIAGISFDPKKRNITLGQEGALYDVRLRTTDATNNGIPSLAKGPVLAQLQHIVFTYTGSQRRIYINGVLAANDSLAGSFSNWDSSYPLVLANEATGDRPWLGELHLVAFYSRALSSAGVAQNYAAGVHGQQPPPAPTPTNTPVPGSTNTPTPTNTPVPGPTNTPTPTRTPDPGGGGGGGSDKEMLIFDWNGPVTEDNRGFARTAPDENGDWTKPVNFAEGRLYFRVEIFSQPEPQDMKLQYCVWQDKWDIENCANKKAVHGSPGTVVTWSDGVADMWMKGSVPIDWTRPRFRHAIAFKNSDGKPVSPANGWNWNGEDPKLWFPIDWHFMVVVVAKGETFSGWNNYP